MCVFWVHVYEKGRSLLIYLSDDQVQKCFENQFFVLFIVLFFFLAELSFFLCHKSCSTYGYAFMFCREYEKDDGFGGGDGMRNE